MTEESLLEFPCQFPIKAMGRGHTEFESLVVEIIRRHVTESDVLKVKSRDSRSENFLAVTVTINARSREQLDAVYMDLSSCDQVLMAL